MTAQLRGADVLAQALARAGTRYLFSLSGNQVMPLYDAAIDTHLDIIHVRHEGGAVHMADAWARMTGQPGVAVVTGGPGHANAIGALYTATASDSPLILLSGHAPLNQLGTDAFQEMRQADMAAPVVKAAWTAESPASLGQDIARAFNIALSGRPGPVHISLPFDVLESKIDAARIAPPHESAFAATPIGLNKDTAAAIASRIAAAKRPLIICGPVGGTPKGQLLVAKLAHAYKVPVLCMESPRGVNDPALGAVAEVLKDADLIVLIAKKLDFTLRFGKAPAFAPTCQFVMIDPDQETFSRAAKALGEPARIVSTAQADPISAIEALAAVAKTGGGDEGWAREVDAATRFRPAAWDSVGNRSDGALHPVEVGRTVGALAGPDDVLVIDGGEFGQWSQACVSPHTRLINGPAGSIGSAIPFALAAKLARPQAKVFALLGDGTFGFHMAEFDTAVRHRLPVVAVIGNDACWNAEHQIQLNTYGKERTTGCELLPTRYDQAVAGLGGYGALVQKSAALRPTLDEAIESGKPACVNVSIDRLPAPVVTRKTTATGPSGH
jgi:acetolactate synthase-1/2/3 large subunit